MHVVQMNKLNLSSHLTETQRHIHIASVCMDTCILIYNIIKCSVYVQLTQQTCRESERGLLKEEEV